MIVTILHEREYSRNGEAFLAPLIANRRCLARDYGMVLRRTTDPAALSECDVLIVHAKAFRDWWVDGGGRITAWLTAARAHAGTIVWVDTSDGTGTTHFRVLPFVDRYVKNQLLRDRHAYQRQCYGGRLYTDFLHRTFGVCDDNAGEPHLNHPPSDADLGKLVVGWHYGFAHYGRFGGFLGQAWFRAPALLPRWFPHVWTPPSARRPIAVSCRIGLRYTRATIAHGRTMLVQRLAARGVPSARVSKDAYFNELRQSLVAVSPFGYGEICYRDFEAVLSGAAMMKQEMTHLETWPDFWVPGETYLPFAWDGADFDARLDAALGDRPRTAAIAAEAQRRYRAALSPAGQEEFRERFVALMTPVATATLERRRKPWGIPVL